MAKTVRITSAKTNAKMACVTPKLDVATVSLAFSQRIAPSGHAQALVSSVQTQNVNVGLL